ncbi:MAG: hypothetical protein Q4P32_12560, partial [Micrococcales bacterium]|nr:hypothetical protein [Micrococcales bacterium]
RAGADASRAADQATGWRGGDDAPGWAQVEPPHDDDAWVPPPDAPQSRSVQSAAALARGPNEALAPAAGTRPLDSPGPAVGGHAGDAGSSGLVAFRRARADQAKRAGAGGGGRPGTTGAPGASRDTAAKTRVNPSSDRTGRGPAGSAEDEVSADDEVIEDLSAVGQPVIASVLGGVVIGEDNG